MKPRKQRNQVVKQKVVRGRFNVVVAHAIFLDYKKFLAVWFLKKVVFYFFNFELVKILAAYP